MPLSPGQPIRLKPATLRRVPFCWTVGLRGEIAKSARGKVGKASRLIGVELGWELWEVEFGGHYFIVWNSEVK